VDDVLQQRIHRILDKLSEARTRGLACFGSETHGFRLNPPRHSTRHTSPLREGARHRASSDYRAFLRHARNGGAGPYYGIYSPDKWEDFADWVLDNVPGDVLSSPSPKKLPPPHFSGSKSLGNSPSPISVA
jgi:hypothetical protein